MSAAVVPIRERQRALTRVAILDAARQLFESEAYHGVTVEAIATRAGVSRAAFYLHFANKREVLDELIAGLRAEADVMWPQLRGVAASGPDAIAPLVEAFLVAVQRHHGAFRAWMQAGSAGDEITATTRRDLERVRRYVFPTAPPGDRHSMASTVAMVSIIERFCVYWLEFGVALDRADAALTLARAITTLLETDPSGPDR